MGMDQVPDGCKVQGIVLEIFEVQRFGAEG